MSELNRVPNQSNLTGSGSSQEHGKQAAVFASMADNLSRRTRSRKITKRILALVSAFVLVLTSLSLMEPAETMESPVYCGLEAHTHKDECYGEPVLAYPHEEIEPVIVETREYVNRFIPHVHTDACKNASGEYICGWDERYVHQHNEWCYDEEGNLVCGLEERSAHVHTASCYEEVRTLSCGLEETAGHVHTDACYAMVRSDHLICGLAESDGHVHVDSCYGYVCGLEEHVHSAEAGCYDEEGNLICEIPEHEHTEECIGLICGKNEGAGAHHHTDECYEFIRSLVCGKTEGEGAHQHTDDCYTVENVVTCGYDLHKHDASCGTEGNYTCGHLEIPVFVSSASNWATIRNIIVAGHTHGPECYVRPLVCGKVEHVHVSECFDENFWQNHEDVVVEEVAQTEVEQSENTTEEIVDGNSENTPAAENENTVPETTAPAAEETHNVVVITEEPTLEETTEPAEEDDFVEMMDDEADNEDIYKEETAEKTEEIEDEVTPVPVSKGAEQGDGTETVEDTATSTETDDKATEATKASVEENTAEPEVTEALVDEPTSEPEGTVDPEESIENDAEQTETQDDENTVENEVTEDPTGETASESDETDASEQIPTAEEETEPDTIAEDLTDENTIGTEDEGVSTPTDLQDKETAEEASINTVVEEGISTPTDLSDEQDEVIPEEAIQVESSIPVSVETENTELNGATITVIVDENKEAIWNRIQQMLSEQNTQVVLTNARGRRNAARTQADEEVENEVTSMTGYTVFDIKLTKGEENISETGTITFTLNPKLNVYDAVKAEYPNAVGFSVSYELYHLHGESVNIIVPQVDYDAVTGEVKAVTFTTENLSSFVLSYTVDFEYKGVQFSMPGVSSITVSDLLVRIGVCDDIAEAQEFVANSVKNVVFSAPKLLVVTKIEDNTTIADVERSVFDVVFFDDNAEDYILENDNKIVDAPDWVLTSTAPFNTLETLVFELVDGKNITIIVTDDQYDTLASFITDAQLTIDGQVYGKNDTWNVYPDVDYNLKLSFAEKGSRQFPTGGETVYMDLPAGLNIPEGTGGSFDIPAGLAGTVRGNTYVVENGKLKITFGPDPNDILTRSSTVKFDLVFTAKLDVHSGEMKFNDNVKPDVITTTDTDVSVSKTGSYNSETGQMDYVITVKSTGKSEDVKVTDVISGNALTLDTSSIVLEPSKSLSQAVNASADGFTLTIAEMAHNETVTIKYSADVDTSYLGSDFKIKDASTNGKNTVEVENNDQRKDTEDFVYNNEIKYSNISKTNTNVDDSDDSTTLTWTIVANDNFRGSIVDGKISDTISYNSREVMKYSNPLTIHMVAKDSTGAIKDERDVTVDVATWDNGQQHWEYAIPKIADDEEVLSYEFTYTTVVDKTKMTDWSSGVVTNDSSNDHGGTSSGTGVVPGIGGDGDEGDDDIVAVKNASTVTDEYIDWDIVIVVPPDGFDHLVVTDDLPATNTGDGYRDTLDGEPSVVGLLTQYNEDFDWDLSYSNDLYLKRDGQSILREIVSLNFTYEDETGKHDGLKGTGSSRTITIKIRTKNDPVWVEAGTTNSYFSTHVNTAKVNGHNVDATGRPVKGKVTKTGKVMDSTIDGAPAFQYDIMLSGITEEPIELDDYFDSDMLEFVDPNSGKVDVQNYWMEWGNQTYSNDHTDQNLPTYTINTDENGKQYLHIVANNLKKTDEDTYYPFYHIRYILKVKDDKADVLKNAALANKGTTSIGNSVKWGDLEDSVDVDYKVPVMTKEGWFEDSIVNDSNNRLYEFLIDINPSGEEVNGGEDMELTDTHTSNVTVEYNTIKAYKLPDGVTKDSLKSVLQLIAKRDSGEELQEWELSTIENSIDPDQYLTSDLSWDFDGNIGTFSGIKDSTHYVIVYGALIVGNDTQDFSNEAEMEGFIATKSDRREFGNEASGSAKVFQIGLIKHTKGATSNGLQGAKFQLFRGTGTYHEETDGTSTWWTEDKIAMTYGSTATTRAHGTVGKNITFTTGSDGYVLIALDQTRDGEELEEGVHYYLKEIESPAGYQIDSSVEYWEFTLTMDPDEVNYGETTRRDDYGNRQWIYFYYDDILKMSNTPTKEPLTVEVDKSWLGLTGQPLNDEGRTAKVRLKRKTNDGEYQDVDSVTNTDGVDYEGLVTLDNTNDWKFVWENLPRVDGDTKYAYIVEEVQIPDGFASSVNESETETKKTYNITNTQVEERTIDISVKKEWKAENGTDALTEGLPDNVRFYLYRVVSREPFTTIPQSGGVPYEIEDSSYLVTDEDEEGLYEIKSSDYDSGIHFSNLPSIQIVDGVWYFYSYYVKEVPMDGYSSSLTVTSEDGVDHHNILINTMTNTKLPEPTNLSVSKVWLDDAGDALTTPPSVQVTFKLYRVSSSTPFTTQPTSGGTLYTVADHAKGIWSNDGGYHQVPGTYALNKDSSGWNAVEFTDLPLTSVSEKGKVTYYAYYVVEDPVPGYTSLDPEMTVDDDGNYSVVLSNQVEVESTRLKVDKTWLNKNGTLPLAFEKTDADAVTLQIWRVAGDIQTGRAIINRDSSNPVAVSDLKKLHILTDNASTRSESIIARNGDVIKVTVELAAGGQWNNQRASIGADSNTGTALEATSSSENKCEYQFTVADGINYVKAGAGWANGTVTVKVENTSVSSVQYVLTQEEAESAGGAWYSNQTLTLNATGDWAATSDELPLTYKGVNYTYFVIEPNGDDYSAEYVIDGSTIHITNREPATLEIDKTWLDASGNALTKTDGTITYELHQLATEIPQPSTVTIDYSQLKYGRSDWNHVYNASDMGINGTQSGSFNVVLPEDPITVGSTISIQFSIPDHNNQYNNPYTGLSVEGGTVTGFVTNTDGPTIGTYTVSGVTSTLKLSGIVVCDSYKAVTMTVTVTEMGQVADDPADSESTDKNLGTVTVSKNAIVSTTLSSPYTVNAGSAAWSAMIGNLPKTGDGNNYTYYVKETRVEGFEAPTYSGAPVAADGTITITNKKEPVGDLKLSKTFSGDKNGGTLTASQKKAMTFTVYNSDMNVVAKVTYDQFTNDSYTIQDLPVGTYSVWESGYGIDGYLVAPTYVGLSGKPGHENEVTITNGNRSEVTVNNDYDQTSIEVKKVWKDSDGNDLDDHPESATVELKSNWDGVFVHSLEIVDNTGSYGMGDSGHDAVPLMYSGTGKDGSSLKFYVSNADRVTGYTLYINGTSQEPVTWTVGASDYGYVYVPLSAANNFADFKVELQLKNGSDGLWGVYSVWLDGQQATRIDDQTKYKTVTTFTLNDNNEWQDIIDRLPRKNNGQDVIYTLVETDPSSGYEISYSGAVGTVNATTGEVPLESNSTNYAGGTVTVTNKKIQETGSLEITKVVKINGTVPSEAKDKKLTAGTYTFTIYKEDGTTEATKADESPIETLQIVFNENGVPNPAKIEVDGLEPGEYVVKETAISNTTVFDSAVRADNNSSKITTNSVKLVVTAGTTATDESKVEFTNNLPTTEITIDKTWLVGTTDYKERLTELFGTVTVQANVYVANANASDDEIAALTTTSYAKDIYGNQAYATLRAPDWEATVRNLPVLGSDKKYVVKEYNVLANSNGDIKSSFTTTGEGFVDDGRITITNTLPTTELTVTKEWTTTWPTDVASVQATITATGTETAIGTLIANSTGAKAAKINLTSSEATMTWNNLPVYDNAGNKITYSVSETSVTMKDETVLNETSTPTMSEVFDISSSTSDTTTTITNTRLTGSLNVTKELKYNNGPDTTTTATFYAALFVNDVKVSDVVSINVSNGSGTAEFTGLDAGVAYTLKETDDSGTPVGDGFEYAVSYENQNFTLKRESLTPTAKIINNKSEKGQLTVNKSVLYNGATDTENGTSETPADYKVAIFTRSGEEGSYTYIQVGDIQTIKVVAGATTVAAVFGDLEIGTTYYAFEMDESREGDAQRVETSFGEFTVTNSGTSFTPTRDVKNSEITITNAKTETGSLTVTKHVQVNGTDTNVTEAKIFTVGLYVKNTETNAWEAVTHEVRGSQVNWTETITVAARSATGTATFTGLDVGKTYRVYELNGENQLEANALYGEYKVSYSDESGVQITRTALDGTTSVTNNKETTTINATKKWGDGNNTPPTGTEITWTIKAMAESNDVTSTVIPNEAECSKTANVLPWTAVWTDLPTVVDGKAVTYTVTETGAKYGIYTYTAEEIAAANSNVVTTTDGTFAFTNTLPTIDIKVNKEWVKNDTATLPESITYTLTAKYSTDSGDNYLDNEDLELSSMTTSGANTDTSPYSAKWSGLPLYTSTGNEIIYEVTEGTVSGFKLTKTEEGNSSNDYTWTFTNTETTSKSVSKIWGEGTDSGKIEWVKYKLTRKLVISDPTEEIQDAKFNAAQAEVQVTAEDSWSKTWSDLDAYGEIKVASHGDAIPGRINEFYESDQYIKGKFEYEVTEVKFCYDKTEYTVVPTDAEGIYRAVSGDNFWYVTYDSKTKTYTNTPNNTTFLATKVWEENDVQQTWPNGTTITFNFSRLKGIVLDESFGTNGYETVTVEYNSTKKAEDGWSVDGFRASVNPNSEAMKVRVTPKTVENVTSYTIEAFNLEDKYYDKTSETWESYTYYLEETSFGDGYSASYSNATGTATSVTSAQNGYIITNFKYSLSLPSTGGIGDIRIIGLVLSLLSLCGLALDEWKRHGRVMSNLS